MLLRILLYMIGYLILCQYCSRCSIFNDLLLVQGTMHILIGERRCITSAGFHEFDIYIPMVLMVCAQNDERHLPVHMIRV